MARKRKRGRSKFQRGDCVPPKELVQGLFRMAANSVCACLEYFCCDRCGTEQFASHHFTEVLECGRCGHHCASRSPRPVAVGEITVEHLLTQIGTIHDLNDPSKLGESDLDLKKLTPAQRLGVAVMCRNEVRSALEKIVKGAAVMAGSE